jgi:type 1 glutamine amidotransferase
MHPNGDALPHADLLGWARMVGNSPTVYLQPGDGPSTYADPHYRRLLANAINWVAATSRTRGWA